MIWTLAIVPLALLFLGTPIFAIFLTGAMATFVLFLVVSPPVALHQIMFGGLENYALLAMPFFIFAGELMGGAGIADRLIAWVLALDRPRAGQPRGRDGRRLHADRGDFRRQHRDRRGGRPHALSGPRARRLWRALFRRARQFERARSTS